MPKIDPVAVVDAALAEGVELRQQLRKDAAAIAAAGAAISAALAGGGKLLVCGNGGSAADAQHIAAELVGRFSGAVRPALAAMALTTDTSALTAIANDLGYDHVFARQVEALGRPGDVLLAISTSGRSPNVLAAARAARARGVKVIGLCGRAAGPLGDLADLTLCVPGGSTARIQELHITVGHILCDLVERALLPE
ncbi:MAG TPA: SIS domain-containing protein [Haliangiales bacterium]|nr:SIS domain-containing protein [Haliangiales bacterium]